jgi:hypothetical protein
MFARSSCRSWALVVTWSLLGGGCGTGPEDRLLEGSYVASYDPPLVGYATLNCDRLITYAFLAVNSLGGFDLSISVTDDCSRVGGGLSSFEVLKLGTYTRHGATLSFTPDRETASVFTGHLEGEYVRLTLPAEFEALAPNDLELLVGPRLPL